MSRVTANNFFYGWPQHGHFKGEFCTYAMSTKSQELAHFIEQDTDRLKIKRINNSLLKRKQ